MSWIITSLTTSRDSLRGRVSSRSSYFLKLTILPAKFSHSINTFALVSLATYPAIAPRQITLFMKLRIREKKNSGRDRTTQIACCEAHNMPSIAQDSSSLTASKLFRGSYLVLQAGPISCCSIRLTLKAEAHKALLEVLSTAERSDESLR